MMSSLTSLLAAAFGIAFALSAQAEEREEAVFAGGCFWCVEADFDKVPGVLETVSGYTGGKLENPTYEQVTYDDTGHREAVRITYDPSEVSYEDLLTAFWHSVDPTDGGGQFCDRGYSYQTAIFADDDQREAAEASKAEIAKTLDETIATMIEPAGIFYPAEGYHQNYYKKNPVRYKYYRWNCGRDQRIEALWGERAFKGIPGLG